MKKNKQKRVTLFLNPNLLKHAKTQAIVEEIGLTVLVERALSKYLPKKIILRKDSV